RKQYPYKGYGSCCPGHERVLRARLSDAGFFYKSDLEIPPDARVEKLKSVLFQAKLGSMYEKSMRVVKITEFLADGINADPDFKNQIQRAARLCKSDLVSQVVIEFTKLQGVMGRVYAAAAGETEAVANAIEEHYRPTYSGGPLPKTAIGALLSIADKIDSICGCFSVGLVPTGAADPYALRRQGIGIIQIILDQGFVFPLSELITFALTRFKDKTTIPVRETAGQVYDFLVRRMNHLLVEEGFSKDVVAAITEVSADHVPNVWNRVKALEELKAAPDFEPLATAFKRVVNIMKKTDLTDVAAVDAGLFEDAAETALHEAFLKTKNSVEICLETADFNRAFLDIASLRNMVDDFFEKVLVMTKEDALRINRLALLGEIAGLFGRIADFSRITT
ncbi:MAG: glycine--tRNA ligase subunit beta, partial [Deltaproteobacteria bacterium]|nr:glycine--tRNA ligase subunit beta [Deltaproteobacteria bacterium]